MTKITGSFWLAALHSAVIEYMALPSPITATTRRVGSAICTPTAAAMPQPMPPLTLPKKLLRSRNAK